MYFVKNTRTYYNKNMLYEPCQFGSGFDPVISFLSSFEKEIQVVVLIQHLEKFALDPVVFGNENIFISKKNTSME